MIIVYADASVQSSGNAGIGWKIVEKEMVSSPESNTVVTGHDSVKEKVTSVQAEFLAVMQGLKEALRLGERERVHLHTDCQPVVDKIKNHIPVTKTGQYINSFYSLIDHVEEWSIAWIRRSKNTVADREAHVGLDKSRQA